jgi:hypothetical protein
VLTPLGTVNVSLSPLFPATEYTHVPPSADGV